MLYDIFLQQDDSQSSPPPRPIILLGHAVDNDTAMLKAAFGVDIEAMGVVVATLDTQVLATECEIAEPGRKMGLGRLLGSLGVEEAFLHNAGNDIVGTFVGALVLGCTGAPTTMTRGDQGKYEELNKQAQNK
ncbi:hypothetical protein Ptr902_10072 [Pyrenophora tritici-repentis]|nr:hypothetical protein PtrV1_12494 [Pyrenophora tritici-repentis]KAF7445294.1 hypothetical protein A1F99_102800 [Pyrenophora tritici-repentis]KAF7565558.1 hypothetical protein PtrM4_049920 [Pyrenophora tritici-repentis]KAI0580742.1 hypothetical protein Alg215_05078 [Pyrenophora tritici-repentis]KAI0623741.1 hypothetical protein TUN199_04289 [Pyrenophora tritici-repentis]